ncbi:hypothetical protein AB0F96_27880 [Streptomyces sp. NPDC023998]|uniref:hypothetical protein n=1 Tax=Streptomyces sp. NPDC023998 TaxID=3154597 RepID=UPI0033CB76CD
MHLEAGATGQGRNYLAGGDQHITHLSVQLSGLHHELERGTDIDKTRAGTERVVVFLYRMVGALEDRCAGLEKQAQEARAGGRAEALEEIRQDLEASEARLQQVHLKLRRAREERDRAEALLADAQRAADEFRRAAEVAREQQAGGEESGSGGGIGAAGIRDLSDYDRAMQTADEELEQLSRELHRLSDNMRNGLREPGGERVVQGEVVPGSTGASFGGRAASQAAANIGLPSAVAREPQPAVQSKPKHVPGPRRPGRVWFVWAGCLIAPCILMFMITSLRAAFSAGAPLWQPILFTVPTVVVCLIAWIVACWLAGIATVDGINRNSEADASCFGQFLIAGGSLLLGLAAFWTPLTWPGPAGAWGSALVAAVGLK